MSHLFARGLFNMVFDHFQDAFDLKNFTNKFFKLHQLSSHVAMGCLLGSIARVLGAIRFLALANPLGGIRPSAMGEIFYWLVNISVATALQRSVRMTLTLPKWGLGSPSGLPKIQNAITRVKTPRLEVFFILLERS
jgi:hypothetical protein